MADILYETVVAIWEQLQPEHMPVPTVDKLRSVAEEF